MELFVEQRPLFSKVLVDGHAGPEELESIEEATGRLARYYGLALSLEAAGSLEPAVESLSESMEAQARALTLAADGKGDEARACFDKARGALGSIVPSSEAGDPRKAHAAAELVYDRATGHSKYDFDPEGWLSFHLRCPNESCLQVRRYRLIYKHPTHRFECSACTSAFVVFLATVVRAQKEKRHSFATYRLLVVGADGAEHEIVFDYLLGGTADGEMRPDDLVLLTYDSARRLRQARNYSTGQDFWVRSNGRCFVASAASGPNAWEVTVLRRYRDDVLTKNAIGRAVVRSYEAVGPGLAWLVMRSRHLRKAARRSVRLAARLVAGP